MSEIAPHILAAARRQDAKAHELRDLRRTHGMSQRELAEALAVHVNTISDYETGRRPIPPSVILAAERVLLFPR